ncbi:methyltetrahydrofolate cobalamin methyltransferase [Candidatus Aerophobetes bacterium]|uniref:Methyltetrahydrofolate cobalamin methyltransferase n=1 Tax=Aerophobetes bacterium TaxID=2030807 RepID=A0A523S5F7_UNCAE|nr:MAG: methyltetrahydrofolate cobalamin methyltransferase [Candidatus Aerophobetes bacterium]
MFIVGEKINTSIKDIEEAVKRQDAAFIQDIAREQVASGANMLDVNVGTRIYTEPDDMKWIVKVIQEVVDLPFCIDSPNPEAIEAGLSECKGKAMVNSITAEEKRVEEIFPLLKKFNSKIVALTMDDKGIPEDVERRYSIAEKLIEVLTKSGVALEDIYIDPLVRPIGTDSKSGLVVLESIKTIMSSFKGVHTICGLSNVSFGLPKRSLLNRAFLLMAMAMGLDAVIMDPLDKEMMSAVRVGEAILGRDEYCTEYLTSFRQGKL